MGSARLLFRYLGISVRAQMQYRASFVMLALGHLLSTGIEFGGIWVLFQRFGHLRGWSLPEVALLYGAVNVAFALTEALGRGFDVFPGCICHGEFDRILLRPRPTWLQVAGGEFQLMRVGRLAQGIAVLVWALWALPVPITAARLILIGAAICGTMFLFYGLFVIQATISFWTVESLEIMNTVTYGGTETASYPMSIYRRWFRLFFTVVVPLALTVFVPVSAGLARPHSCGIAWVAPLAGVAFLWVALRLWQIGERHYTSTGS